MSHLFFLKEEAYAFFSVSLLSSNSFVTLFIAWNPHSSSWEQPWSLLYSNSNLAFFVFRICYPPVKLGFLYTKFLGQFSWFLYPVFSDTQTQAFVQPLCIYQVLILYKAQYYNLLKFKANQKFILHQKNLQTRTWTHL